MPEGQRDRSDVYSRVTSQIVRAIEAGVDTWVMPWHAGGKSLNYPVNAATGVNYTGVNVLALWAEAQLNDFSRPVWATFRQWSELDCSVRKGEKAAVGVFWKRPEAIPDEERPDDDDGKQFRGRWLARAFPLFNADQVDGYEPETIQEEPKPMRIAHAEQFFSRVGASVRQSADGAFYNPMTDRIYMPPIQSFDDPIAYYSTLAHELTHWTGAVSRLNRDLSGRFGSERYAAEELIAELGAAFLCADLSLALEPREDHAAYIDSWLRILKADSRAIFSASSHAQQAARYLNSLQPDQLQDTPPTKAQATSTHSPAL